MVYYFHIPGIAEEPIALCARQFPDNAEALQMIEAIVDRGRGDKASAPEALLWDFAQADV